MVLWGIRAWMGSCLAHQDNLALAGLLVVHLGSPSQGLEAYLVLAGGIGHRAVG